MERSNSKSALSARQPGPPAILLQAPPDRPWLARVLRPGRRRAWPFSGPLSVQAREIARAARRLPIFIVETSAGGGLLARGRIVELIEERDVEERDVEKGQVGEGPVEGDRRALLDVEIVALPEEPITLERLFEIEVLAHHAIFAQPDGLFFPLDAGQAAALEALLPAPERPVIELSAEELTGAAKEALIRADTLRGEGGAKEIELDHLVRGLEEARDGKAHRVLHRKGPVRVQLDSPVLATYQLDEGEDRELMELVEAEVKELLTDYELPDEPPVVVEKVPAVRPIETGWLPPLRLDDAELPLSGLAADALAKALAGGDRPGPVGTVDLLGGVLSTVHRRGKGLRIEKAMHSPDRLSPIRGGPDEAPETESTLTKAGGYSLPGDGEPDAPRSELRGGGSKESERAQHSGGPQDKTTGSRGLESAPARRLQTALYDGDGRLPEDRPLVAGESCLLRVGVDARDWGLGEPGRGLDEDLDPEDYGRHGGLLPLRVAVRSSGFEVSPPLQGIDLPQEGPSGKRDFVLVPGGAGRRHVDVDLLFEGRLLRTRRVEIQVVDEAGESLPESAWPIQDAYDVFDGIEKLDIETVEARPRRRLSVIVEREGELIGLRFYRWDGEDLGFVETRLSPQSLSAQLESLRISLSTTMKALAGFVGFEDLDLFTEHLAKLASVGRTFRRNLLREAERLEGFSDALDAAEVIQVAPLSNQVGVPWEILYDRAIETWRENAAEPIRLCPSLAAGRLPAAGAVCNSCGDANIVCPNGFWGFRRVIEQLPYRRRRNGPPLSLPPRVLGAEPPIRVDACTYRDFYYRASHLENLASLAPAGRWSVHEAGDFEAVKAAVRRAGERTDLLYFYAHGGVDDYGRPFVKIGDGEMLIENDFEAWELDLDRRHPLVLLNICDSAHYSAESFENLIQCFVDAGAAGVIATQCDIRELLADAFARELLSRLLASEPVGTALLAARRALLDRRDPRGLVYSLFAESELRYAGAPSPEP